MKTGGLHANLFGNMSEIFAWTVDFFGLQKGDNFKVIYEEFFIDGRSIGTGRTYAAQFNRSGSSITAIPFIQDGKESFFDSDRNSLRKAFLKAPLQFSIDPEIDEPLSGVNAKHRFLLGPQSDEALLRFDREPRPWQEIDEDATATINYTSGTTARPKGVQITHRNIWVNAVTFGLHAGVTDWDTYLHTLPMFHANGWGMPFTTAGMGCTQVVLRKVDGTEILQRVEQHDVSFMCAAPAVLNAVLDARADWSGPVPGADRVTRVIAAGAPPPSKTIERIEDELGWEFCQIYGLTETSPLLTINRRRREQAAAPITEVSRELGRAGAPAIGVQLQISDSGEVLTQSNVVLEGYWNQPDVTADALEGGWFHTGDGGSLDDDGYLTISDRKKDVIITGGENVSSIEVEDVLYSADGVAGAR